MPALPPCPPGGILFEFAGGAEAAAELREMLRQPEQLVQHPGHMQQLIGMVDTARKLLTVPPGSDAAAGAAVHAAATTGLLHEAAAADGAHMPGSAFHLPAVQHQAATKSRGGRKRKGTEGEGSWQRQRDARPASCCCLGCAADMPHVPSCSYLCR